MCLPSASLIIAKSLLKLIASSHANQQNPGVHFTLFSNFWYYRVFKFLLIWWEWSSITFWISTSLKLIGLIGLLTIWFSFCEIVLFACLRTGFLSDCLSLFKSSSLCCLPCGYMPCIPTFSREYSGYNLTFLYI